MILIIGGTGSLARAAAVRLMDQGHTVRVMTRTPEKVEPLLGQRAEVVQGDLLDKASLERACDGANKVLTAAHSIFGRGKEASKYVDLQGHIDCIDAAKAAGVEHFLYTSVYPADPVYNANAFFRIHRQVENYLQQSGLDYSIMRAAPFMESHAEMLIGDPILKTGKVTLFGKGENPRNFVAVDDVAQIATMILADERFKGRIIDVGGPENLTNMQVVHLYEELAGKPAKVRHVPLALLRVMSPLLRPFHPGLSQVMLNSIFLDTLDSTFDAQPLVEEFPIELTYLADWVQQRNDLAVQRA